MPFKMAGKTDSWSVYGIRLPFRDRLDAVVVRFWCRVVEVVIVHLRHLCIKADEGYLRSLRRVSEAQIADIGHLSQRHPSTLIQTAVFACRIQAGR